MKRNLLGLGGTLMIALAAVGCTDDPLDAIRRDVASVATSLSYVEIIIGDSAIAQAQARDAQGNALGVLPDVSSANTAVAVVNRDEVNSGSPAPETIFNIVATGFGVTTVTASAAGQTETITVQTWPAGVTITGSATDIGCGQLICQVPSGVTFPLTSTATAKDGSAVTGPDPITTTWAASPANIVTVDATGNATTAAPGLGIVSATVDGGANSQVSFEVVPAPFDGTLIGAVSGTSAVAYGEALVISPGAIAFDANTIPGFVDGQDPITFEIDGPSTTGNTASLTILTEQWGIGQHTITVLQVGPNELAYEGTFSVTSDAPANFGLGSAPDITAGPYPQNLLMRLTPGDPNQFYILNPVADLDVTVTLNWFDGGNDLDILWVDCPFTMFVGNFNGASLAHPEQSAVTVPAGDCWALWLNLYAGGASDAHANITSP
ncbi:MAG: hypothetical protein ACE5FJ_00595 [Gemmatimonadales bacterium]